MTSIKAIFSVPVLFAWFTLHTFRKYDMLRGGGRSSTKAGAESVDG